jgi:hypothetical protein
MLMMEAFQQQFNSVIDGPVFSGKLHYYFNAIKTNAIISNTSTYV